MPDNAKASAATAIVIIDSSPALTPKHGLYKGRFTQSLHGTPSQNALALPTATCGGRMSYAGVSPSGDDQHGNALSVGGKRRWNSEKRSERFRMRAVLATGEESTTMSSAAAGDYRVVQELVVPPMKTSVKTLDINNNPTQPTTTTTTTSKQRRTSKSSKLRKTSKSKETAAAADNADSTTTSAKHKAPARKKTAKVSMKVTPSVSPGGDAHKDANNTNNNGSGSGNGDEDEEMIDCECCCKMPEPAGCFRTRKNYSLYLLAETNRFRAFCLHMTNQKWFDHVILTFIALNCVTLAMERPNIPPNSFVSQQFSGQTIASLVESCRYLSIKKTCNNETTS